LLPVCSDDAPASAVERYLTHYCIARTDVPVGTLCAQLIHAAGESSPGGLLEGTRAVALAARSEMQLLALEKKLISNKIQHVAIREPDLDNQLMAIGIAPCDRSVVRKVVSNFPLIK